MRTRYFPRAAALANVPVVYAMLYGFKTMLPNVPFRLGFPNGLMSESMVIRAFLSTSPPYAKRPKGFYLSGALHRTFCLVFLRRNTDRCSDRYPHR